jgi:hypothetical protein
VGTPKNRCVCSSCWHRRCTSPSRCGCLSDYPQLPRHLWTDAAVHDETSRRVFNLTGNIFSTYYNDTLPPTAHKLNVSGHMLIRTFFLVLVRGNVPKVCPHLSVTPCMALILTASLNNQFKKRSLCIEWLKTYGLMMWWRSTVTGCTDKSWERMSETKSSSVTSFMEFEPLSCNPQYSKFVILHIHCYLVNKVRIRSNPTAYLFSCIHVCLFIHIRHHGAESFLKNLRAA